MANHIRICKVDDDNIIFLGTNSIRQLVAYFVSTHLRFQVISSNLRGFYKDSILTFIWLLNAAIEEEGYMCIFLGLSNTCLSHVMCCQILTEGVGDLFFFECNGFVRDSLIVFREAYVGQIQTFFSLESGELICAECSCQLSCTVRAEVEENHRVFILNCCNRFSVFLQNGRQNELICFFSIIRSLNSLCCIGSFYAFPFCQRFVSQLDTIPAVITVHCIVTAGDHADFADTDLIHFCLQLLYIRFSGCRRSVTAIQEAVYINFLETLTFCQFQKSEYMGDMAVNTAVREKSEQVQCGIICFCIFNSLYQLFILEEIAVLDCFRDSGQLLIYNAACAHVQMAYLRVTHLSVRKTYSKSAGLSFYVRALAHQLVHNRSFCFADSVMLAFVIQSISVKNH